MSRRESKGGERDVFNERPTREDQSLAVAQVAAAPALPTSCTIHTSMGDIVSRECGNGTLIQAGFYSSISSCIQIRRRERSKTSSHWLEEVKSTSIVSRHPT